MLDSLATANTLMCADAKCAFSACPVLITVPLALWSYLATLLKTGLTRAECAS